MQHTRFKAVQVGIVNIEPNLVNHYRVNFSSASSQKGSDLIPHLSSKAVTRDKPNNARLSSVSHEVMVLISSVPHVD